MTSTSYLIKQETEIKNLRYAILIQNLTIS